MYNYFIYGVCMNTIKQHWGVSLITFFFFTSTAFSKTLDTLVIQGLSINQPSAVNKTIPLKQGEAFTSADIQDAIKALYRTGLFREVTFYITEETDSSAQLLLKVTENPVCESIEFDGNKKLKTREIEEKISLHKGMVVSDAFIHENIQTLKKAYAEEGYLLSQIQSQQVQSTVPGNVIVKFVINEGKKVRIEQITFEGNEVFSDRRLKRKLETKEKGIFNKGDFDAELFRSHLDTLLMYYWDKGYLDAQVSSDSVWYGENKEDIFIHIVLHEGKQYFLGDVFFTGNKILDNEILAARSNVMKKGKPFSKSKFEMTKLYLTNAYRDEGYLWAMIQDNRQYRDDTIDITFEIKEGRAAVVRKIDIVGNNKTREKVIRREFALFPGQKYKQSNLERSIRDVMQLTYFNNVMPDLRPNEDGTIDLVVNVEEKDNIGQFSAGLMYSQVDGLGGNFKVSIPNFRGTGELLEADIQYAKRRQKFSVNFLEPWIFDSPTSFSVSSFYEKSQSDYSDFQSIGLELGGGRRLKWPDDYFKLFVKYRISSEKDLRSNTDPFIENGAKILQEGMLSKLKLTLSRNDTDIPIFPTRGSNLSLTTEIAGLGGDYSFTKAHMQAEWYYPLFWKFVLGAKSNCGLIANGINGQTNISRYDLFRAGGVFYEGKIRGYDEGMFQGLTFLTMSAQISFPILPNQLYFAVFGDMGNAWDRVSDINFGDMYGGVGFGFRLNLPMLGLIGVDFAWGLRDPYESHFKSDTKFDRFQPHFIMQMGF